MSDRTMTEPGRLGPLVPKAKGDVAQAVAEDGLMLRVLVGSTVHGTAILGQDDRDEMGICVEPPETVTGLRGFKHYQYRTQPEGVCSGPGDLDLIVYSLRRYAGLAASGNPTVLLPLFVPEDAVCYSNQFGAELRQLRAMFLSKQCGERFKGYLHSQREGLMGLRSGGTRNQGRQDIRARYGFDTKFATHMVRLGLQGVELLSSGEITLPMRGEDLAWLRELRCGERSREEALTRAEELESEITNLIGTSRLPERPAYAAIDSWLDSVHRRHWGWA